MPLKAGGVMLHPSATGISDSKYPGSREQRIPFVPVGHI